MINKFNFLNPVKIVFGSGCLNEIGSYVRRYGQKAMLVTTGTLFQETGLVDRITALLADDGISTVYFSDISPNPLTTEIDQGAQLAKAEGCQFIIGLGGGSAMDGAKGIAISATHPGGLWRYCGVGEDNKLPMTDKILPIICITTTSGTGSHVTPWAVFTNPGTMEKPGMGCEFTFAKVSFVDPEILTSMPARLTASTGFDALTHAMEAYTSRLATPMTDMYAAEAMKMIGKYLVKAVQDPASLEARSGMAYADTLAGVALSMAEVTLCHAMAHAIGGIRNAAHGEALAALTPYTIRFSMKQLPQKFAHIGMLLQDMPLLPANDIDRALQNTIEQVEKIRAAIHVDFKLSDLGVQKEDLDPIARKTLYVTSGSVNNDYQAAKFDDILAILNQAL